MSCMRQLFVPCCIAEYEYVVEKVTTAAGARYRLQTTTHTHQRNCRKMMMGCGGVVDREDNGIDDDTHTEDIGDEH